MTQDELQRLVQQADQIGVRLEVIAGQYVWEASPAARHQEAVFRIQASIKPLESTAGKDCGCFHLADVLIRFPDDSLKRPDIAIFCRRPDEQDDAITLVPEAVVEIISKGSEVKDLELAPYFYLAQGVKDVVIFDPFTLFVLHARRDGRKHSTSPVAIQFECGCQCEV